MRPTTLAKNYALPRNMETIPKKLWSTRTVLNPAMSSKLRTYGATLFIDPQTICTADDNDFWCGESLKNGETIDNLTSFFA